MRSRVCFDTAHGSLHSFSNKKTTLFQQRKYAIIFAVNTNPKHVVVALRMAGIAGQDKLSGIFEYLSGRHRWNLAIYRTRHEFTAQTVKDELARGASGFIIGIPGTEDALAVLAKSDRPVVLMNLRAGRLAARKDGVSIVRSDANAVGREAAHTLLAQGVYKSYAFAGYRTDDDWSRDRGRVFRDTLKKSGFDVRLFDVEHFREKVDDRATLVAWLKSLPKPCGILAACDDRAYEIVDACAECGLRIPAEIGLLGVNNDPLLCENSNPSISSVQPDFRKEGYLAAQTIDRMMSRGRSPATILVGIRRIVHRESTYPPSNSGFLIQKALAYIERNATRKMSVDDVARHLKISRSLLDLRFRELQRETVHDAILRARIDEVKRRLRTTADTIERISSDCGWANINSLKNTFRRATNLSMRDYRDGQVPSP